MSQEEDSIRIDILAPGLRAINFEETRPEALTPFGAAGRPPPVRPAKEISPATKMAIMTEKEKMSSYEIEGFRLSEQSERENEFVSLFLVLFGDVPLMLFKDCISLCMAL